MVPAHFVQLDELPPMPMQIIGRATGTQWHGRSPAGESRLVNEKGN